MLSSTSEHVGPLLVLAVVALIISRLVRFARQNAAQEPTPGRAAPHRPLWGPTRRLERLQQNTAIVRGETELLISTGEHLQASHNLHRLRTELEPARAPRPGQAAQPALTVPEIRAVLDTLELAPELHATILELVEATANEKTVQ